MAYLLTNLLQELAISLGQTETFKATGGSTTTIINTKIAERADQPEENYAIDYFAFIARDAGGANAAPEGEFQRVQSYDSGSNTFTVDTAFTVAPASGDDVMMVTNQFPVRDIISVVNAVLRRLFVTLPDVTLTTISGQYVYTLPVTSKYSVRKVEVQTIAGDNDSYVERNDFEIIPASEGSTGSIRFINSLDAGMTVRIFYEGPQAFLWSYSAVLSETIPPTLILAECKVAVCEWFNNRSAGADDSWKQRENMARSELDDLRRRLSVKKDMPRRPRYFQYPSC